MTPKDKAIQLVKNFENQIDLDAKYTDAMLAFMAKGCASICCDELIEESHGMFEDKRYDYWQSVKNEIENL